MTDIYQPEGSYLNTQENREHTSSLAGLEYAMSAGLLLEGRASLCDSMHNLIVDLGPYKGMIPREEAVYHPSGEEVRDIAVITRVGKAVCFKITSIEKQGGTVAIRLSRRLAQKECYERYVSRLAPGDIIDAKITHLEPFGCFCDVGCGIVSLLSIDCISVSRIMHPKDRFFVGEYIRCAVKQADNGDGRITLTHKELLGTWEENAYRFSPGETVAGIVRSIEPYGIFVELAPNLAGLAEWRDGVEEGQSAAVFIKSILPEKMKIKLVIVDSHPGERSLALPEYFVSGDHIRLWRYSPVCCERLIQTVFDNDLVTNQEQGGQP